MPAEKAGMELCRCEGAKLSYGVHELVPSFTLHLHTGHRYALLGRNGVGKTTLFNAIADGTLPGFPPFLKVSYLKQEQSLRFKEKTVLDHCVACVMQARQEELRAEQEHLEARLEAPGSHCSHPTLPYPLNPQPNRSPSVHSKPLLHYRCCSGIQRHTHLPFRPGKTPLFSQLT